MSFSKNTNEISLLSIIDSSGLRAVRLLRLGSQINLGGIAGGDAEQVGQLENFDHGRGTQVGVLKRNGMHVSLADVLLKTQFVAFVNTFYVFFVVLFPSSLVFSGMFSLA